MNKHRKEEVKQQLDDQHGAKPNGLLKYLLQQIINITHGKRHCNKASFVE
jgi:hypothetical protein